jgi:hypothetical protein
MLRLIRTLQCLPEEVEVDHYVPITVGWSGSWADAPAYVELGDDERAVLEIGLEPDSGCIRSVTLIAGSAHRRVGELLDLDAAEQGHPCCALSTVERLTKVQVRTGIEVSLGPDYVVMDFSASGATERSIVAGRGFFGFDQNGLMSRFGVRSLSQGEAAILAEALSSIETTTGLPFGSSPPTPQ